MIILYVIIYYVLFCVRGRSSAVIESLSPACLNSTRETGVQHLDKPTKACEIEMQTGRALTNTNEAP